MLLLVDIGNTRLKWCCLIDGQLRSCSEVRHDAMLSDELLQGIWSHLEVPSALWYVSVASPELSQQLQCWAQARWQCPVQAVESPLEANGLRNGYRHPERLGADRWLAMLGAQLHYPGAACIADCGTAVTIDCIDGEGRHRGGVIVPGLRLMPRCVAEHTSRVPLNGSSDTVRLGRDTAECLAAGALHAVAGSLESVARHFELELGTPVRRVVTGGDAERLLPLLESGWCYERTLIFIGLALMAGEVVR